MSDKIKNRSVSKSIRITLPQKEWDKINLICQNETRKDANFIIRAIGFYLTCFNDETGEMVQTKK